nr:hypothetical protein GCM10023233_06330 [Brevibacterium otitidis]
MALPAEVLPAAEAAVPPAAADAELSEGSAGRADSVGISLILIGRHPASGRGSVPEAVIHPPFKHRTPVVHPLSVRLLTNPALTGVNVSAHVIRTDHRTRETA